MKNILSLCILNLIMLSTPTWGESTTQPITDQNYGTLSGRIQSLNMYRDYEGRGNGANGTLGFMLNYASPEFYGFDAGATYNYVGELFENNNTDLLLNDPIHILNEAWGRYNFGSLGLTNTTFTIGRKISNGEVFRKDEFREKGRSIEAIQLESKDHPNHRYTLGHAIRMSNWIQVRDLGEFNDFGDVFKTGYDTDGITWGEIVNSRVNGLEVSLFDAYAWDVANLIGTRVKYDLCEDASIVGYYRHENDVGKAITRHSDAYGISLPQKIGGVTLEPGYFGVRGSSMRFHETTTGINHPLGATMMICSGQFNGDSDTAYLKAVTKLNKTVLYALYNYTWHNNMPFDGQELNLVIKQPVIDNLTACVKAGVGKNSKTDATDTDVRLIVTYTF